MSARLCIATRNAHKLEEIRALVRDLDLEVTSALDDSSCADVEEDAPTLEGNAEKKARWVAAFTGLPSLADDTGLEVDALGGAPGVLSARFAGPACSPADNVRKLLGLLTEVEDAMRTARFRCVLALALPSPEADRMRFPERAAACTVTLHEGVLEGEIARAPQGAGGFGYDPVFWIPELGRTLAELTSAEKNAVSHRGRALRAARPALAALAVARPS
jgi:XTP/dITP diphosphohydrolase